MLRVGRVGVKVSLKQPLDAGLMLQDLAYLALQVWVQYKSRLRHGQISKVSLPVLCCSIRSTHNSHIPIKQDTTPTATTIKGRCLSQLGLFRLDKLPTLPQHSPLP